MASGGASRSSSGKLGSTVAPASHTLHRLLILSRPTAPELPDLQSFAIRRATGNDDSHLERDVGTYDAHGFRARLSSSRCYLAMEGGHILHSSWCSRGPTWTEELQAYLAPPPSDAYVYESVTVPTARGRGIYPMVLGWIAADLHSEGIPRIWIGVEMRNASSVRAILKAGFEEAYSIRFEPDRDEVVWEIEGEVDPATSLHIVTKSLSE